MKVTTRDGTVVIEAEGTPEECAKFIQAMRSPLWTITVPPSVTTPIPLPLPVTEPSPWPVTIPFEPNITWKPSDGPSYWFTCLDVNAAPSCMPSKS